MKFGAAEHLLMNYLSENGSVTLSKFRKIAGISSRRAEAILANLIILKIIIMNISDRGYTYELNPEALRHNSLKFLQEPVLQTPFTIQIQYSLLKDITYNSQVLFSLPC